MTKYSAYFILLTSLGLSGCLTLAPDYEQPEAPVANEWPVETDNATNHVADLSWEAFFQDEKLQAVINQALINNRDLQIAHLNIERAQALYRIQRADLLPSIQATGTGSKQRIPATLSGTGSAITPERYDVSLGFTSYELDLFGRIRSLKKQALERFLASEHAHNSARISLIAAVANAYIALAADHERLQLARDTFEAQEAATNLIRQRFNVGAASEIDLRQSETAMEAARVDIARYTGQVAIAQNALTLLVGANIDPTLLPTALSSFDSLPDLAPGTPSEVLQQRPDILQAESQLKAANANIGAARAAFFPRIALTAAIGTASDELSGLFKSGSDTWNFAPAIALPIFETGRKRANLRVAKVDRDIAVANYERAIQTAFREVADTLVMRSTLTEQINAQQALVDATAATHRLAEDRYKNGIDSQLVVLDAQRSLYGAQQGLVALQLAQLTNRLTLYKALGGQ